MIGAPLAVRWEREITGDSGSESRLRTVYSADYSNLIISRNRVAEALAGLGTEWFSWPSYPPVPHQVTF